MHFWYSYILHSTTVICTLSFLFRVLLDPSKETLPIIAERILLQPFHLLLAVERNLSPLYTKIPVVFINLTMGEFKVYLGQDDLEELAKFGADVGFKAKAALQDMGKFIFFCGYSTGQ